MAIRALKDPVVRNDLTGYETKAVHVLYTPSEADGTEAPDRGVRTTTEQILSLPPADAATVQEATLILLRFHGIEPEIR